MKGDTSNKFSSYPLTKKKVEFPQHDNLNNNLDLVVIYYKVKDMYVAKVSRSSEIKIAEKEEIKQCRELPYQLTVTCEEFIVHFIPILTNILPLESRQKIAMLKQWRKCCNSILLHVHFNINLAKNLEGRVSNKPRWSVHNTKPKGMPFWV